MSIVEARKKGAAMLANSPTPWLDVDVILAHILACEKAWLIAHRDDALSQKAERRFFDALSLRGAGLPIAYITGRKEFYGLDFCVTRDVLIPKPDTELLVERALEFIDNNFNNNNFNNFARRAKSADFTALKNSVIAKNANGAANFTDFANVTSPAPLRLLDVCAGSGCVGISIAHELAERGISVLLTLADISEAALAVAKKNAARLLRGTTQTRVSFVCSDLFAAVPRGNFDVIVSNPPYVPSGEVTELLKDGRNEPRLALDGGSDGLAVMRRLVPAAYERLTKGGALFVESGEDNAAETAAIMKNVGFLDVTTYRDLSNLPRVTKGFR